MNLKYIFTIFIILSFVYLINSESIDTSTTLIPVKYFNFKLAAIFVNQKDLNVYYEIVKPSLEIALEKCKKKYEQFFNLDLVTRMDSKLCTMTMSSVLAAEEYYLNNINGFIGPSCLFSLENVGRLAAFWNIPLFTAGDSSSDFNDKTLYKTITRMSYNIDHVSIFIINILREYDWKHISLIVDETDIVQLTLEKSIKRSIKLERSQGFEINLFTINFMSSNNSTDYNLLLKEASQESRLIIILMRGNLVRNLLLTAYDMNMHVNGEYTFIAIELIKTKKIDNIEWYKYGDKRNKEAKIIFESLFIVSVKIPLTNDYKNFVYEVSRRARNEFKNDFTPEDVNQNIAAFHDTILIYCFVLNETLSENEDPFDGEKFVKRLWNRMFLDIGLTGDILINDNGDRETDYTLEDFDPETGKFRSVYNFFGSKRKIEKVTEITINWPGKKTKPPLDVPFCGFRNENPECVKKTSPLVFVIIIFLLVLFAIIIVISYIAFKKIKLENNLNDDWWRIHLEDIKISEKSHLKNKSSISLTKSESSFKTGTSKKTTSSLNTYDNLTAEILYGHFNGVKVAIKYLNVSKFMIKRENLIEFKQMRDILHKNLVKFYGICIEESSIIIISDLYVRGSVRDILENCKISIDWTFKCSIINDIIEGMIYLHNSAIGYHGHLKSTNLVIDSRFNVAVCDYGLRSIYSQVKNKEEEVNSRELFWTAPEHLREKFSTKVGSKKGDMYSFAIIMQEIITKSGPFENLSSQYKYLLNEPDELIDRIRAGTIPPFRPEILPEDCEAPEILPIINLCWSESPEIRPEFIDLKNNLKKITRSITSSKLLDNLMKRIETYSSNLEKIVTEKTENIVSEKMRTEDLLNNILPSFIVNQLKNDIPVLPESFPSVTIMFSDIIGFHQVSSKSNPQETVNLLNDIYSTMDDIIAKYHIFKMESILDAYLVASGVPVKNDMEHVRQIAYFALEARQVFNNFKASHMPEYKFQIRVGIHSGSCVAGIVGLKMPKYCLFGDTINTASRMQTTGEPGKIHISLKSKELLDIFGDFVILPRNEVELKGKGVMKTFWLENSIKKIKKKKKNHPNINA